MNTSNKADLELRRDQLKAIPKAERTIGEQEELERIEQKLLQMPSELLSAAAMMAIANARSGIEKRKVSRSINQGL